MRRHSYPRGFLVSTVYLRDLFVGSRPYETMVFWGNSGDDLYCRRYPSAWQAALEHVKLAALINNSDEVARALRLRAK